MNWKPLIHSLIAAAVGGALTSITAALADSKGFNLSTTAGLEHIGSVAGIGALTGVLALLKQSPLTADAQPAQPKEIQK